MQKEIMHNYDLITSNEGFRSLENDWIKLENKTKPWVYQDYYFLESVYTSISPFEKLNIVIVAYKEDNVLKAILPLCIYRKKTLRILAWLGSLNLIDHGEILFDADCHITINDFIDNSIKLIRENTKYEIIYFGKILINASVYDHLNKNYNAVKFYKCGFIQFKSDFDSYLDELKINRKNLKSDTLRQIKRISEAGNLQFEVIPKSNKDLTIQTINELINQRRSKYKNTFWATGEYNDVMVNLALNLPYSHLSCLKINEQIIAAHFGLIFKNTFTFCVPSYDSRFAKYSPGRLLIYFLIKHCFDSRISYFDFGPGEETYKYEWSNNIVEGRSFIGNSVLEKLIRVYTRLGGKI